MKKPWKIGITIFLIPAFLLATNVAYAQSPAVTRQVSEGEQVPFDGLLFNNIAAARNKVYIENIGKLHANEFERLRAELKLSYQAQIDMLNVKLEHNEKSNKALLDFKEKEIQFLHDNMSPPGFFNTGAGGILIGVIGTLGLVIVTGYALGNITPTN